MPPIGEGAVPTISSTIGSGATPTPHNSHTQHRTGTTIGSGAAPSASPFTIGSGARPTTDPFAWSIGSGARPNTTTTTERRDPFADFNKPRTTSSLFPPRETKNERSSSFNHVSLFDEPRHNNRSHTVCHVETGAMTSTVAHGDDPHISISDHKYIVIGVFLLFVIIGIILTVGFTVGFF